VIRATLYTDPGCPWGYSANPALRVLEWRFGNQLDWRLVMIGLREEANQAGFDAARRAAGHAYWRDTYGMPFGLVPKARAAATGRGCRAVVAAGQLEPGLEWAALRALYFGQFTTDLLLDDDEMVRDALVAGGLDGDAIVARLDDPEVAEAYEAGKVEARTAAGTAAEAQDKTATSDGPVRYTAPSVVFERTGDRLVAGGWQPLLAYDVLLANMDPTLRREPPPEDPAPLLERFPGGLTTAEVAKLLADGPDCVPDSAATQRQLIELEAAGAATRTRLGQDALWKAAGTGEARPRAWTAAALA
jgi:2-hydroxychromene-2-carboxylate isomerase